MRGHVRKAWPVSWRKKEGCTTGNDTGYGNGAVSYGIRPAIVLAVLPFRWLYGQRTEFVASRAAATSGTFASQAAAIPPLVTDPLAFARLFFLFFELPLAARSPAALCQLFLHSISCNSNADFCAETRETCFKVQQLASGTVPLEFATFFTWKPCCCGLSENSREPATVYTIDTLDKCLCR